MPRKIKHRFLTLGCQDGSIVLEYGVENLKSWSCCIIRL